MTTEKDFFPKLVFTLLAIGSLFPAVSSGVALLAGTAFALTLGNPFLDSVRKSTHRLLAFSVVGLGAGMDLGVVARVGLAGVGYTILTIGATLALGAVLGKLLRVDRNTSVLVTVGTAICGGSAIAAVASTLRAKHTEASVALGTVFILNATALFVFPWIGHQLDFSQVQFGLWSALAIHDTSSVVGAGLQYGAAALEVGTTVKLARALWIIPVAMGVGLVFNRGAQNDGVKAKRPWFILGFLIAAALVTWIPAVRPAGHWVEFSAKRTLVLTLFLIGSGLTKATLQSVGFRPFIQGFLLWVTMAAGTAAAIYSGHISF